MFRHGAAIRSSQVFRLLTAFAAVVCGWALAEPPPGTSPARLDFRIVIPRSVLLSVAANGDPLAPSTVVRAVGNVRTLSLSTSAQESSSGQRAWALTVSGARQRGPAAAPLNLQHTVASAPVNQVVTYTLASP